MSSQRRYAAGVVLLSVALFLAGCPDVAESSDNEAPNAPAIVSVTGVILTPDSKNLVVGTSVELTAAVTPSNASNKNLSWISDNEDIASVDENGKVTAKEAGNATITVTTAEGGHSDSSSITVTAASVAVTGITLSPESVTLVKDGTCQLSASISPSDATNDGVTWSTSDSSVATVSSTGLVTAVSEGNAEITVTTSENGFTDSTLISVPTPAGITGNKKIRIGFTYTTSVNLNYSAGNVYIIWLENKTTGKKQHLYICNKLLYGGITNYTVVLPYWHINRFSSTSDWVDNRSDIDSITGATLAQRSFTFPDDFVNRNGESLSNIISSDLGDVFTLYFEIDQSCQYNDWFNVATPGTSGGYSPYDEPAVLYSVDINLASSTTTYNLTAEGWTPHVNISSSYFAPASSDTTTATTLTAGEENRDMRYITHSKVSGDFGASTPAYSSTSLISSITATITDLP